MEKRSAVRSHRTPRETVPKNELEAIKWYVKAAEQGYPTAQHALGLHYGAGGVIPQNNIMAYMWLNLAAASGIEDAATSRDATAKSMTSEEIAAAQKMSSEWKPVGK